MQERQEQRQGAMALLESQLALLAEEKDALEKRNAALEQAMRIKEEQQDYAATPASWDPDLFIEVSLADPEELLPRISVDGNTRRLSKEDLAKLSLQEHIALYTAGFLRLTCCWTLAAPHCLHTLHLLTADEHHRRMLML